MVVVFLFLLNILLVAALWHLDVNHNLDKLGQKKTTGVFKISPETGYRLSQYAILLSLFLIDILFVLGL